ncbi:MAG TPA: hypothetical protein VMV79_08800, partial [Alphaproteobacteria bacterium]|nr:hypothetical protein [Alphaproteobacteria bacterium]
PNAGVAQAGAAAPGAAQGEYYPILPYGAGDDVAPELLPIATSRPLDGHYQGITRAVVAIHDLARDANKIAATLATLAGAANDHTLIIAPQFPLVSDINQYAAQLPDQGANVARWPLTSADGGWDSGGQSMALPPRGGISSFAALDEMLLFFGDKNLFPDLKDVVVAGHGAGADFVLRYAALGKAPDLLAQNGLPVRFVAANPSSYLYFTPLRPLIGKLGFTTPEAKKCPGYDAYKYGLNGLDAYGARVGANAIRLRYPSRHVIYLAGAKVAGDDRFPDTSCAALLEGPDRLARAMEYDLYLRTIFGDSVSADHRFHSVADAGYDAEAMFGSACGISALFGGGACAATN